jgi:glycosyltransferase involved in cell wall biosynthesis
MREARPQLSFVVPVYDEAESLATLHGEIVRAAEAQGLTFEVIYVDDGSRDGSDRVLLGLADQDPRVRVASFRKNFGKSAALALAFGRVRGEYVMTLDADLQDDPAELRNLLRTMEEGGYDVVSGWKVQRRDPWTKTLPSKLFNAVTARATRTNLHDMNCGLKLYRREVVEAIEVYGELHRFLPALANWKGFKVGECPVHHRARQHGRSKFGASRFVNGFLDLMAVSFVQTSALKPLHVFGRAGLGCLVAGFAIEAWFLLQWALGEPLRVRPLLVLGGVLAILGIQLLSMGLLGEMIASQRPKTDFPVRAWRNWGDEAEVLTAGRGTESGSRLAAGGGD